VARYSVGDIVAVVDRYELVGRIIAIDEKGKGHKVHTSKGEAYRYEKEIILISLADSKPSSQVVKKLDQVGKQVYGFDSIRKSVVSLLESGSNLAKAFADYILKVSVDAVIVILKEIQSKGLNITIQIAFVVVNN